MANIRIIGTGHLASAIAKLYKLFHLNTVDNLVVLSNSSNKVGDYLYGSPIRLSTVDELLKADIIILAIPADKAVLWVQQHRGLMNYCVLIDCSNKIGNGQKIYELMERSTCATVKAFTKINVFQILDTDFSITNEAPEMPIASSDLNALDLASKLIARLGFRPKALPSIEASADMEKSNFSYFKKWHWPMLISCMTWCVFGFYAIFERNLLACHPWYFQLLQNINVAFSSSALALFGFIYGMGAYAEIKQRMSNKNLNAESDPVLVSLLNKRKQLGLVALLNLMAHFTISLLLFGSTYYKYFSNSSGIILSAAISLFCGILSYLIYSVTGLTSLPSVGKSLGMMEWRTVQSYMGWGPMLLAVAHVAFMGFGSVYITMGSGLILPSTFLLSIIAPLFAFMAKALSYGQGLYKTHMTQATNQETFEQVTEDSENGFKKTYLAKGLFFKPSESVQPAINSEIVGYTI